MDMSIGMDHDVDLQLVRPAARAIYRQVRERVSDVIVIRALQVLQWDAQRLLWCGVSQATDPVLPQSGQDRGDESGDESDATILALRGVVGGPAAYHRLVEDVAVLASVTWALACSMGACGHEVCTVSGTSDGLIRSTEVILFMFERGAVIGVSCGMALLLAVVSATHALLILLEKDLMNCIQ